MDYFVSHSTSLTFMTSQDTFEDADDSTHAEETISLNPRTRSLTQRSLSSNSVPKSPDTDVEGGPLQTETDGTAEDEDDHHTLENKDHSSPAPTSRLSKISLDNSDLDNVDLEGETNGIEKPGVKSKCYAFHTPAILLNYWWLAISHIHKSNLPFVN